MVHRSRSGSGEAPRRLRKKDAFLLLTVALLLFVFWQNWPFHQATTQTHIYAAVFSTHLPRRVDDKPGALTLFAAKSVRGHALRLHRKQSTDKISGADTRFLEQKDPVVSLSSYSRKAAAAWEQLVNRARFPSNIGRADTPSLAHARPMIAARPQFEQQSASDRAQNGSQPMVNATSQYSQRKQDIFLPAGFDWRTYLLYYPDLVAAGIKSEQEAKDHYVQHGRAEGRLHRRVRVLLRYTACSGLINQHYSHISAFALATAVGAELVLPPAVQRDSFAKYFSMIKDANEVNWTPVPLSTMLDVAKITDFWQARGMLIHEVRHTNVMHSLNEYCKRL